MSSRVAARLGRSQLLPPAAAPGAALPRRGPAALALGPSPQQQPSSCTARLGAGGRMDCEQQVGMRAVLLPLLSLRVFLAGRGGAGWVRPAVALDLL